MPCEPEPAGAETGRSGFGPFQGGTEMWETNPSDLTADSVPLRAIIIVVVGVEVMDTKGAT